MEIEENEEAGANATQIQEFDLELGYKQSPSTSSSSSLSRSHFSGMMSGLSATPSATLDNHSSNACTLYMVLPSTEPPRQQIIVQNLPSIINFQHLQFLDPAQLKPIDLSAPLPMTSVTLDPDIASKITEMNTSRVMPELTSSRALVSVSHCRNQLRLARKQVLSSLGVPSWSEEKKLLTAVKNDDVPTVIQLLQDGVDPNVSDCKKRTPFHIAASQGLDTIVIHLIAARADPNRQDILGNTPLHLAVCRCDARTVSLLLRSGAKINLRDNVGRTPLCIIKSRFGTLRQDKSISTDKLIKECHLISDILKVHGSRQPDTGSTTADDLNCSSVDMLCNMIKNISTREQVDEIADTMIEKMSQLCIVNTGQPKKQEYYLSIL